jgi:hypothetical protein
MSHGVFIRLIPIIGLIAICRGGRWNWDPISLYGIQSRFIHRLLLGMFWLGWSTFLVVGVLKVFGAL